MDGSSRSVVAQTQPCNHGIDIDACLFCAEFAAAQVWLSDTEAHFHNRLDCESRVRSEVRGTFSRDPDWRRRIELARAEREGARSCPECRPYDPRRWRKEQSVGDHISELRLTHFTTFDNLISIIDAREVLARNRLGDRATGLVSEASAAARSLRQVGPLDGSVSDCVPLSLTHRPSFMDAVRAGADDRRLLPPEVRPSTKGMVALETTFYRLTHTAADSAAGFRIRWAVSARDATHPIAGFRNERADLVELVEWARDRAGGRFAEHPIARNGEFLVKGGVPFRLVDRVVVPSVDLQRATRHLVSAKGITNPPDVRVRSHWFENAIRNGA